jgi:PhoPQ-activated pathogenicity-related protein
MIAWAWRQFHANPTNWDWLPRMPMAKGAFQSMRAAQDFLNNKIKIAKVENWLVSGASKRGWTTWMTGVT